jgi:hypothetical protein
MSCWTPSISEGIQYSAIRPPNLGLLHEGRRFVRARPPTCRHGNIEQPQVHAKLTPMLVPMAEHDVTQELPARLGQDFLSIDNQTPCLAHCGVVEGWQHTSHCRNALFEGIQYFLAAGRLWKAKTRTLRWIALHKADNSAGHEGEMIRELPGRHGFFMRLPIQLIVRQPLKKLPCDSRLYFKFGE